MNQQQRYQQALWNKGMGLTGTTTSAQGHREPGPPYVLEKVSYGSQTHWHKEP